MTAFTLGRMRHLDLLALYFTLRTGGNQYDQARAARLRKDQITAAILRGTG